MSLSVMVVKLCWVTMDDPEYWGLGDLPIWLLVLLGIKLQSSLGLNLQRRKMILMSHLWIKASSLISFQPKLMSMPMPWLHSRYVKFCQLDFHGQYVCELHQYKSPLALYTFALHLALSHPVNVCDLTHSPFFE